MRAFKTIIKTALILVMAISLNTAMAGEDSQKVNKRDVPPEVLKSFIDAYSGTPVRGIAKEMIEGKTYYEFQCGKGETEKDITYLEDGTLFSTEEEIASDAIPQAVMDAVKKAYPNGEIFEAEKLTRESEEEFKVAIEMEEDDEEIGYKIVITPDGKIKSASQIQYIEIEEGDEDDPGDIDDDDEEDDD